jgi:hypothetical protein
VGNRRLTAWALARPSPTPLIIITWNGAEVAPMWANALDGEKQSTSCPDRFVPRERVTGKQRLVWDSSLGGLLVYSLKK